MSPTKVLKCTHQNVFLATVNHVLGNYVASVSGLCVSVCCYTARLHPSALVSAGNITAVRASLASAGMV